MILKSFVILLVVNVALAQAQGLSQYEFINASNEAAPTSLEPYGDIRWLVASTSIMEPYHDSWRHRTHAAAPIAAADQ